MVRIVIRRSDLPQICAISHAAAGAWPMPLVGHVNLKHKLKQFSLIFVC